MNIGLIFAMIVAVMMMISVLIFGYDQITKARDLQELAEYERVMKLFKRAAANVYNTGGETSGRFTLSLPSNVERVCFVPLFYMVNEYQNGEWVHIRTYYERDDFEDEMEDLLDDVLDYDHSDALELSSILSDLWVGDNPVALVFFTTTDAPVWYDIPHLEPSKDGNDIKCALPGDAFWLARHFDDDGAWIDVEEI